MQSLDGELGGPVKRAQAIINTGEEAFIFWCNAMKLARPVRNFRFHKTRKFEIDFAWPSLRIGVEIQGGVWTRGAHGRPANIIRDMVKHNLLLDMGWRVYHYTPSEVISGLAVQHVDPIVWAAQSLALAGAADCGGTTIPLSVAPAHVPPSSPPTPVDLDAAPYF
jgi:very-short-patch-repair endonuclease